MAWFLQRDGVLVSSVPNLAFLVLPKALAGRQDWAQFVEEGRVLGAGHGTLHDMTD